MFVRRTSIATLRNGLGMIISTVPVEFVYPLHKPFVTNFIVRYHNPSTNLPLFQHKWRSHTGAYQISTLNSRAWHFLKNQMEELVSWNHANLPEIPGIRRIWNTWLSRLLGPFVFLRRARNFRRDTWVIWATLMPIQVDWQLDGWSGETKFRGQGPNLFFLNPIGCIHLDPFTKRVNLICLGLSGVEILPNGGGERIYIEIPRKCPRSQFRLVRN